MFSLGFIALLPTIQMSWAGRLPALLHQNNDTVERIKTSKVASLIWQQDHYTFSVAYGYLLAKTHLKATNNPTVNSNIEVAAIVLLFYSYPSSDPDSPRARAWLGSLALAQLRVSMNVSFILAA